MKIAIVGSGALGCFYGAKLCQQGLDVHFLMRSDYAQVREHGLHIQSPLGDLHLTDVSCADRAAEIGPVDLVVIALKTTANHALHQLLPPLLHEKTKILTLQNGLGNEAYLSTLHPKEHILGGLCFVCINRTAPGHIHHLSQGRLALGLPWPEVDTAAENQQLLHTLQDHFETSGLPCQIVAPWEKARWKKLVWNIPFNGLSISAGGIDVSQILADPELTALTSELMQETIAIASAEGHSLDPKLAEQMINSTREMGDYRPSSLIDYQEGRSVEVDSIWSQPFRRAQALNLPTPRLEELERQLQTLTSVQPPP